MTILTANSAASMDRTALSLEEKRMFNRHAAQTISFYCAGCTDRCEAVMGRYVPISDMTRALMYAQGYGDNDRARNVLAGLDLEILSKLDPADLSTAEKCCPRKLPLARILEEIHDVLA